MLNFSRHRFYWVNFGIALACAAVVFLMFDMTKIDIWFSNLLFDPVTQTFPLDKVHFFEKLTHKWARIIPNWTAEIALVGMLLSFVWPLVNPQKPPAYRSISAADQSRPPCCGLPAEVTIAVTLSLWWWRLPFAPA